MKKTEASLAIQVIPKTEKANLLPIVDSVITYLQSLDLNAYVAPFETTIEGNLDTLMEAAKHCQKICIEQGADSVSTYIKITYNPHKGVYGIDEKTSKYKE